MGWIGMVFVSALALWSADGRLECSVKKDMSAKSLGLTSTMSSNIKYKSGQSSTKLWSLDCRCPGSSSETFDDNLDTDLADDMNNDDWKSAAVLVVGNCFRLTVDKASTALYKTLDRSVLVIENVEELTITQDFNAGLKGIGNFDDEEAFSSIYFRNSSLVNVPSSSLRFQEKAEVVFFNMTLDNSFNDRLSIEVTNRINKWNPILRIEQCDFSTSASTLTNPVDYLQIDLRNNHKVVDSNDDQNEGCELDYRGELYFKRNKVSYLSKDRFKVVGASKVMIEMNIIEVMDEAAFNIAEVEYLNIRSNTIRHVQRPDAIELTYTKVTGGTCTNPDLAESKIKASIIDNAFWDLEPKLIKLSLEGYTTAEDDKITEKILVKANAVTDFCDCTDRVNKPSSNPFASEIVMHTFQSQLTCWSMQTSAPGARSEICAGKHPKSLKDSLLEKLGLKSGAGGNGLSLVAMVLGFLAARMA